MSEYLGTTQNGPASPSYVARAIDVSITLGQGTFGQTASNAVSLSGLLVVASINKRGTPSFDQANLRIYGMQPSLMNQLSTLGVPQTMGRPNNIVSIRAGDAVNGMTTVFTGTLTRAYEVLSQPDTCFNIDSWAGWVQGMKPGPSISYPNGADVATIMASLANQMGLAFENSGVQISLASPYFAGTPLDQAQACARAANIEMAIDSGGNPPTLAIWPKTGTRGGAVPLISAASGLIDYPQFEQYGMSFRCIFNPSIRLGGQIKMQSTLYPPSDVTGGATEAQIQAAGPNGYWYVQSLTLDLASQQPDGPWFCACSCARTTAPIPQ